MIHLLIWPCLMQQLYVRLLYKEFDVIFKVREEGHGMEWSGVTHT